jgi:hypothetical protein
MKLGYAKIAIAAVTFFEPFMLLVNWLRGLSLDIAKK